MTSTECISTSRVLWILVFVGFAVNYMIRININIAIVAMVQGPRGSKGVASTECVNDPVMPTAPTLMGYTRNNLTTAANTTSTRYPGNVTLPDNLGHTTGDVFDWDEHQQGLVLGSFFWMHWITQVPGGILARRYGTKLVFGLANALPGVIGLLIPLASRWDYRALLVIRFLQGIIAGFCWPSMHSLTSKWVPPNERSKFVTAYLGSSVGAAATLGVSGLLIASFGWPSVFYCSGVITIIWLIGWCFLVYDAPSMHPRISEKERRYIEKALGEAVATETIPTPWKAIFTSMPMWINVIAQWGAIWALFTLLTQAPSYFKNVHHWDVRMTGFLSGFPHICRIILAAVVSHVGDFLLQKEIMSRTCVRKLATAICNIGQGVFALGLAFSGCNALLAVICLTTSLAMNGAVSTGALSSMVDISPNFASIVMGISTGITVIPGFISPYIVGILTLGNQSTEQWKKVFLISGLMSLGTGLMYIGLADSELQPWNSPKSVISKTDREMQNLTSKKNSITSEKEKVELYKSVNA